MEESSPQKATLSSNVKEPNTAQKLATKVVSKAMANSSVVKGQKVSRQGKKGKAGPFGYR